MIVLQDVYYIKKTFIQLTTRQVLQNAYCGFGVGKLQLYRTVTVSQDAVDNAGGSMIGLVSGEQLSLGMLYTECCYVGK